MAQKFYDSELDRMSDEANSGPGSGSGPWNSMGYELQKKLLTDLTAAQARIKADDAAKAPNGYAGPIKNNEAPPMGLMAQMQMYQQQKGNQLLQQPQNQMGQPQSTNPYQQAQDSRYSQAVVQPPDSTQPGGGFK